MIHQAEEALSVLNEGQVAQRAPSTEVFIDSEVVKTIEFQGRYLFIYSWYDLERVDNQDISDAILSMAILECNDSSLRQTQYYC